MKKSILEKSIWGTRVERVLRQHPPPLRLGWVAIQKARLPAKYWSKYAHYCSDENLRSGQRSHLATITLHGDYLIKAHTAYSRYEVIWSSRSLFTVRGVVNQFCAAGSKMSGMLFSSFSLVFRSSRLLLSITIK